MEFSSEQTRAKCLSLGKGSSSNTASRGTLGHGLGATIRGVGATARGDKASSKGRVSGANGTAGGEQKGWDAYSADKAEDGLSWENDYASSWGGWSDNCNDNGERFEIVKCICVGQSQSTVRNSGKKECWADVFFRWMPEPSAGRSARMHSRPPSSSLMVTQVTHRGRTRYESVNGRRWVRYRVKPSRGIHRN